jgi:GNAT superfamily N-acetyltransferase
MLTSARTLDRGVLLRAARGEDAAACGRLAAAALLAGGCAELLPHARRALEDDSPLPCEQGRRLVAERGGRLLGFTDFDPDQGYLRYLLVEPGHQRRGIGSALLRAVEAALAGAVTLDVFAVNHPALCWYLRRGYRIDGGELDEDWHGGPVVWVRLRKEKSAPPEPPPPGGPSQHLLQGAGRVQETQERKALQQTPAGR